MDQAKAFRRLRIAGTLAIVALAIAQGLILRSWIDAAIALIGIALLYSLVVRPQAASARGLARFRSIFDNAPNAMIELSMDGSIRGVNDAFGVMTGYRKDEVVGQHFSVLVTPGRLALATARTQEMLSGSTRNFEGWFRCKDGTEVLADITPVPIRVEGEIDGVFMRCRNLTGDRALVSRLEEKDARVHGLYNLVSSVADAGLMIDEALSFGVRALDMPYGFVTQLSEGAFTVLHRYGPGDHLPVGLRMPVTGIGRRLESTPRAVAVDDIAAEPYAGDVRERGLPWRSYIGSRIVVDAVPYGALIFMSEAARATPFEQADRDFVDLMSGLIGSAVVREIRQKQLEELAANDALTGLPNRRSLEVYVRRALTHARNTNSRLAIHYLDLDEFKPINDRYGHAAGDEVLCEAVRRWSSVLRERDLLARIGGDEFVAVETVIGGNDAVEAFQERLARVMDAPMILPNGESIGVSVSLGSATYPEDGESFNELLDAADAAMLNKKQLRYAESKTQSRSS